MRPQGAFATERPWREAHRDETGVSLFRVIRLVLLFLSACFFLFNFILSESRVLAFFCAGTLPRKGSYLEQGRAIFLRGNSVASLLTSG